VSADGQRWFLLNASPDLRWQIERTAALQPLPGATRGSPIEAVLLTNADLDHTLRLLLLREGQKLPMIATSQVQNSLSQGLHLPATLEAFCGAEWRRPAAELSPLLCRDSSPSGLLCEAVPLAGKAPRYLGTARPNANHQESTPLSSSRGTPGFSNAGHCIGYRIVDPSTGGRLLFLPDVAVADERLRGLLAKCDALLFDGTFWSEHEMENCGAGVLPASAMGHLPISVNEGSLKILAALSVKHKIYLHINNTNPVLFEDSPERAAVSAAGCLVGRDGMELAL